MIDKILHAITNRRDFSSPHLRAVSSFVPVTPSPAASAVMAALHLDDATSDYYVHAALATIDAYPDIREGFQEGDRSYRLRDFQRPVDTFLGVEPIADTQGPFNLRRRPAVFPVDFTLPLSYLDFSHLGVRIDGQFHAVACSSGSDALYPEWPEELGISGGLRLVGQSWGSAFQGSITHMPPHFPYAAVAALLEALPAKNELLLNAGLIEHYAAVRAPSARLATVLLALGLSNLRA
jgi:hypothetical protein